MALSTFPHIIHRQVLELALPTGIFPPEAQERLKNKFYEALPQIEQIFSVYSKREGLTIIDKIVLDLGHFDYEKLDGLFSSRLCAALSDALSNSVTIEAEMPGKILRQEQLPENFPKDKNFPTIGEFISDQISTYDIAELRDHSATEALTGAFFYFLINGVFPWWLSKNINEDIEALFLPVTVEPTAAFINNLKNLLANNKNALNRLLYQFSEDFNNKMLLLFQKYSVQDVSRFYEAFSNISLPNNNAADEKLTSVAKTRLCFEILLSHNITSATDKVVQYFRQVIKENMFAREDVIALLDKEFSISHFKEAKEKINTEICVTEDQQMESFQLPLIKPAEKVSEEYKSNSGTAEEKEIKPVESIDEYVYVDHAGLVLLHPFLYTLFSGLELLDGSQQFRDEQSQTKAVHLLAFLASGKMFSAEPVLPFCKFLCGMPLRSAIQKDRLLTKDETEECGQLLEAVIRHWSALKNTSPAGLREAFLERKGKLDLRGETPVLFVEAKAHDVLLEKLPWGISYVQMPWLHKPFTTIWN